MYILFMIQSLNTGAFEVQVNDTLVHSKLSNLAFPDYNDVARNVRLAADGKPVEKVKEQPITDCSIQWGWDWLIL